MSSSFERLIEPLNGGRKRTKKQLVSALYDITSEETVFQHAASLARHEVVDADYNVLRRIAHHLEAVGRLHQLRALSKRIITALATAGLLQRTFQRLYISPMYTSPQKKRNKLSFGRIAFGCAELVVTFRECFGNHEYPPGAIFKGNILHGQSSKQVNDWRHVFEFCPNLTTLTVVTESCGTGVLWNRTSTALTALRTAFEEAGLSKITTLKIVPADMIYIGQFKWNGPAFGSASPLAASTWSQITRLELQILPPQTLNENDNISVVKMFNAWLRALAPQLESLKLCYLGQHRGEHPFALMRGLEIKTRGQPNMRLPLLKELWMGGVRNVGDYDDLFEQYAPELVGYRTLVDTTDEFSPVAFDKHSKKELWAKVRLRGQAHQSTTPHQRQHSRQHSRQPSKTSIPPRPSHEATPVTPMRNTQRSFTTPAQSHFTISSGRPSTQHTRDLSSAFPPLEKLDSYFPPPPVPSTDDLIEDEKGRVRQTSMPDVPKRKRGSSGFSSLFKIKSRPKSEPNKAKPSKGKKLEIKLIGETPINEVPREFLGGYKTLDESLNRYNTDLVEDLTLPPVMKLSQRQQIGQLPYAPGALFEAGSGARLPTPSSTLAEMSNSRRSSGQPTPEQIRKAFEKIGMQSPSTDRVGTNHATGSQGHSRTGSWDRDQRTEQWQQHEDSFRGYAMTGPSSIPKSHQSSTRSWETIEQNGGRGTPPTYGGPGWGARRSTEEGRYEQPVGNSGRNSKRMSQLEDVLEEDDGQARRRFMNPYGYY